MTLTPAFLDELRARTTLSALIGRTVKLTRPVARQRGCCPFHNEKTPSFYVNDEKGFYHCFGCSAHGDAIRWMTDQRGLPFIDAVKELAAEAGLEVPAPDPRAAERQEQRQGAARGDAGRRRLVHRAARRPRRRRGARLLKSRGIDRRDRQGVRLRLRPRQPAAGSAPR